jgi:hypothetical protein
MRFLPMIAISEVKIVVPPDKRKGTAHAPSEAAPAIAGVSQH